MKIETLAELSKLLDLCRKKGVTALSVDGLSFSLSDSIPQSNYRRKQDDDSSPASDGALNWDELTPEEQLFYSAGGMPGPMKAE